MYDIIVVGAGPSGSTAAREAAAAGARVLLLDRARFPRDKPCGGGVNVRAARLLPFSIEPVVERTITGIAVSQGMGRRFVRRYDLPLCYMTQRRRLDALLAERAVAAGAAFHDGEAVRGLEDDGSQVRVRTERGAHGAPLVIGADGANGVVARAAGLAGGRWLAVAVEANYPAEAAPPAWRETIAMDLGLIPGGYGWLFPKAGHVNVGVGGWQHFGPSLRARLDRFAASFGFRPAEARDLRGHHLPIRAAGAPLARGRCMLVGDAAGLVDPLSGEGIYAAIFSGRLAAAHALRWLSGADPDLRPYAAELDATLTPDLRASRQLQEVFHLMPGVYARLLRHSDQLWDVLCRLVRGEQTYVGLRRRLGPIAYLVDALSALAVRPPLRERVGLPPGPTAPGERQRLDGGGGRGVR